MYAIEGAYRISIPIYFMSMMNSLDMVLLEDLIKTPLMRILAVIQALTAFVLLLNIFMRSVFNSGLFEFLRNGPISTIHTWINISLIIFLIALFLDIENFSVTTSDYWTDFQNSLFVCRFVLV